MAENSFELSDVFEDLVDWQKRLAGEEPFFRGIFERVGARSVLDAACGTGHHAALFHSWGMEVEGSDISPRMIERARALHGKPEGLRWAVRGYTEQAEGTFDAAVCVGNSLAMSPDRETVGRAIAAMTAAVREGGVLAVHLFNLWRIGEGPAFWQKCRRADTPEGDVLLIKGIHRTGGRAWVELLQAPVERPDGMRTAYIPLTALEAADVEGMFLRAGANSVEVAGGYRGQPYEREKSVDFVVTAVKGASEPMRGTQAR
jgi:SAM-dependent methyltransferase